MSAGPEPRYEIRPYRGEDRPAVLRLVDEALEVGPGGAPPSTFFAWKHLDNPFGRALMLVAETGGEIVGFRAFMRWGFVAGGRSLRAVRAVDTATDARHRGRGIFARLTQAALDVLRDQADLVFNTPNRASGPGYMKMGWRRVGKLPLWIRVRRPIRFLRGVRTARQPGEHEANPVAEAMSAGQALAAGDAFTRLLERSRPPYERISTPKDLAYLRWRYADPPVLDYRAVVAEDGDGPRGAAIFRARPRGRLREASVAELLIPPEDTAVGAVLLRLVARAASVDHVLCHVPQGSPAARAVRRAGFLRARLGPELVVNPLRGDVHPDPTVMSSWAFSLGDLEVF